MSDLYLIRGAPGSGKTTFARTLAEALDAVHVEADDFMVDANGVYHFDPARLPECHEQCQNEALFALEGGRNVVVSNTFTKRWEMAPYLEMPFDRVTVLRAEGNFPNVHGVPDVKVARMRKTMEDFA